MIPLIGMFRRISLQRVCAKGTAAAHGQWDRHTVVVLFANAAAITLGLLIVWLVAAFTSGRVVALLAAPGIIALVLRLGAIILGSVILPRVVCAFAAAGVAGDLRGSGQTQERFPGLVRLSG